MWSGMEKWRNEGDIMTCLELPDMDESMNKSLSDTIKAAYNNQNEIGWYHFHLGRISTHWKRCIRLCYDKDDVKADGRVD